MPVSAAAVRTRPGEEHADPDGSQHDHREGLTAGACAGDDISSDVVNSPQPVRRVSCAGTRSCAARALGSF